MGKALGLIEAVLQNRKIIRLPNVGWHYEFMPDETQRNGVWRSGNEMFNVQRSTPNVQRSKFNFRWSTCNGRIWGGTAPSINCIFRRNSDRDSDLIRTAIQSNSDTDPIQFGQRSEGYSDSFSASSD